MAISVWKKFILLLWKNYRLQWAHKLQLVIELLMPALFSVLLVVVRTLVDPSLEPVRYFKPVQIDNLDLFNDSMAQNNAGLPEYSLFYSPQNDVLDGIVGEAAKSLGLTHSGFLDAASLESAVTASNAFAGIEFEPSWSDLSKLPDKFTYTLRFPSELRTALNKIFSVTWFTMYLFPFGQDVAMGPRNAEHDDGGIPAGYIREGFVPIQNALSLSYIRHKSGTNDEFPEIVMQRYPYAAFTLDFLIMGLGNLVPLIIMLSFIYPCTCITRYVTTEKEKQLKEVMKIMGLSNWLHWSAWFIKSFITMGISSAIIAALMVIKWHKGVAVLNYGSYAALLLFLLIYCVVSICFCFMISPFFTKASTAAAVTGILWFITFLPYSFTLGNYTQLTLTEKLLSCLISNTAMAYGIRLIIQFESSGEGFHLSSLFQPVNVDDELTVGAIMIMMLISAAAYLLICLYIEQIFPGDFGVPRKWYFPFTREFWCGQRNNYSAVEDSRSPNENNARDKNTFEAEPEGKPIGIQLKNLKKKFGKKMAVNGISMNMFEDEITVLLGHNGAGKTTTISMLTGMFPPTSGTATINGNDIRTNLEAARTSLGICPQHNVLFDDMSVGNHIRFFSRLKGLKGDAVEKEVQKYLRLIQLENKEKAFAGTLSGGMKRKLALCCALCGDTKVVLCDEPSSGMDPAARRQLWDLLQQEKIGRTLLLTTHFMDEADVLGDRIAIMCDGELKCYGSSFFLKKHYGSGYSLICVKEDRCIPADVTALLGLYIPGIQPKSDIGAELTYNLPDKYSDRFEKMFGALEERSKDLHLSGYGVGITSMEEVFMKVGAETDAEGKRKDEAAIMKGASGYADDDNESMRSNRAFSGERQSMRGVNLTLNQWRAMMLKKVIYTWRNKFIFAVQNLLCVIFICLTIMIARNQSTFQVLPKMTFSRTQYPSSVTVLSRSDKLSPTSDMGKIADYYESIAKSLGGEHTYEGTGDKNFTDYILDIAEHDQPTVNSRYLVGASMEDDKITAWLNNKPLHTAPLTVNAVHNAMAKKYINEDAEISVSIWPYPYSTQTILRQLKIGNNVGSQMASNLCFAMCFVTSMYLIFLIKERASRAKLLQFVSGVRVWTFWTSAYLWDVATFTFTCLIICLTLRCFDEVGFMSFAELGRYFLVLWIFGLAVLPMTYVCSFMFSDAATGFARLSIFNIFSGVALFFLIMIMAFETFELQSQSKTMAAVFRVLPHFSLSMGLNNVYMFAATERACERVNAIPPVLVCELIPSCCNPPPAFGMETPGVLREIIYLVSMAVISFVLLILGELGYGNELLYLIRKHIFKGPAQPEAGYFEEDVQRERERIINMKPEELEAKNLVLDRVSKYYGPFLAVNQVSLCVGPVECFGLLGVNGAGKTTTFKMMTGDERISSGSAYVQGLNMKTDMNRIYKRIGYCPQFDALLDDLTGREMLRIFCLLRGVRLETIKPISEELARSFGFMKHIDKRTKTYSGGNKRKLSTAIASLGAPSVIYLDEPTTGMDPAARRQLWNVVCRIRDAGKSIVLTSHSMEECEALCTRVAIMVNGEFKCIGSTQHLKNKFSKGLVLKIKVGRPDKEGHGPRASMMSSGSRYRTQDSDDSVPSTPLPYENTSAVSLRRSLDSIKVPRSNGHLTDEQIINQTNDRDAIPSGTRSTVTYRRQSNELVAPVGRRKTAENMQTVKDFVTQKFPDAILQEEYQGMLTYYIPLSGIKWSKIFGVMERNRYDLNVEDYSISQTTLEEIFLDFAKHQREDPRTSHAKKKKKIEVIKKPEDNEKKKKLFERSHREP